MSDDGSVPGHPVEDSPRSPIDTEPQRCRKTRLDAAPDTSNNRNIELH
jgi:hypothetical protein